LFGYYIVENYNLFRISSCFQRNNSQKRSDFTGGKL
jgi:hypothetical protein